jgi:hypothetical protein
MSLFIRCIGILYFVKYVLNPRESSLPKQWLDLGVELLEFANIIFFSHHQWRNSIMDNNLVWWRGSFVRC